MVYGNSNLVTEDYLAGSTPVNVIPSYASFDEMAFFVVESTEEDFNKMMMSIGIEELAYFESTGTEMLYESGNKTLVDKAVGLFESMWDKVQGYIQEALKKFAEMSKKFRHSVYDKIGKKAYEERAKNLKADKEFGDTYEYSDLMKECDNYIENKIESMDDAIKKSYDKAIDSIAANASETNSVTSSLEDDLERYVKEIVEVKIGATSKNGSAIIKKVKDDLRGKAKSMKGADVSKNYKEIINEVLDYPDTKRTLKRTYDKMRKHYNELIRDCKKANNERFFNANVYTKTIKCYKDVKQIGIYVEQAFISILRERYNFYRGVVFKVLGSKKSTPVKATGESTTVDGISSLFNW